MCIDLHLHSFYSDGILSPGELVRMAVANGLEGIALTDHDTVEGIEEFLDHARHDITLIPGFEVSALHRGISVHILGYGVDHRNNELLSGLRKLQEGREKRNREIIGKLRDMGHDIRIEELEAVSTHGQTGRPHIARLLKEKGIVRTPNDAFTLFFGKKGPAWVKRFAYSAAESIGMIHQAGGIAVLAHPGKIDCHPGNISLFIAELTERGLDGIEVYHPSHPPAVEKKLRQIAEKYQLVLSGGSDYHGNHKNFSSMAGGTGGFCPPSSLLQALLGRMKTRLQA